MKKISLVISSRNFGGHEIQAIKLANDLAQYFEVDLFFNNVSVKGQKINRKININIINLQTCAKGNLINQIIHSYKISEAQSLIRKITDNEVIIISAGAVEACISFFFSILRKKKRNIKVILYLPFFFDRTLIWPYPLGNIYNKILGLILNKFYSIITINHLNKKNIEKRSSKPVNIISNKVDLSMLKFPEKNSEPRLLFIGRLHWQKRIIQLVKWCDHKEIPFKNLLIIGDGPQLDEIKKLSKTLKNLKINMTGWLSQKEQAEILRKNDILIINSIIEGDPLVVAESLSRNIKCISRNIESLQPVIHNDYLFNSQNQLIKVLKSIKHEKNSTYFSKNKFVFYKRSQEIKSFVNFIETMKK